MSWIKSLFGSCSGEPSAPRPAFDAPLEVDASLAVIGDIHGCHALLKSLLDRIATHPVDHIIFVGDYVDRGEESAQVLQAVMDLERTDPRVRCLKGNHEVMMLDFIDSPDVKGARWLRYGGLQTLASFGIGGVRVEMSEDERAMAAADLRAVLPDGMENWLRQLPTSWRSGNLWVVHAGADPDVSMIEQSEKTLMWGHRDFDSVDRLDNQWVAHGHTVVDTPKVRSGRIAIDTGAFATGRLTAAIIEPNKPPSFLQS